MVSHREDLVSAHQRTDALENKVIILPQSGTPGEEYHDVVHTLLHQLLGNGCLL